MWLICGLQICSRNTSFFVIMWFKAEPGDHANISGKQQADKTVLKQTVSLSKECSEKVIFCYC